MKKLKPLPRLPVDNLADQSSGNSKPFSDSLMCFKPEVSNCNYLRNGKFMSWVGLTKYVSSFLATVLIVVAASSDKQMVKPDTSWIIASVADAEAVWNSGAFVDHPSRNVGAYSALASSTASDLAVAVVVHTSRPQVAVVCV